MLTTKKCSLCRQTKSTDNYYIRKDKLRCTCKECESRKKKEYTRTKNGLVTKIYASQKSSSKKRCHHLPTYTKQELKEWLYSQQEFHLLYDKWKASGYQKICVPSVDRIDDDKSYTIDNIQIMVWHENDAKGHLHRSMGVGSQGLRCRPVIQYIEDDNKTHILISRFHSASEASKQTKITRQNIQKVCAGKLITAGGYFWKYEHE